MSPVLTQRVAGTSTGVSRAISTFQTQTLRTGASAASPSRGSAPTSGSPPTGTRLSLEQVVAPALPPSSFDSSRVCGMDDTTGAAPPSPSTATASFPPPAQHVSAFASVSTMNCAASAGVLRQPSVQEISKVESVRQGTQDRASNAAAPDISVSSACISAVSPLAELQEDYDLLESVGDISPKSSGVEADTTYIPLMHAPPSPVHSSAPCSPASSAVLSYGACHSSCRLTFSSGMDTSGVFTFSSNALASTSPIASASVNGSTVTGSSGNDRTCPLVKALLGPSDAFRQCFSELAAAPPSIHNRAAAAPAVITLRAPPAKVEPMPTLQQQSLRSASSVTVAAHDGDEAQHALEPAAPVVNSPISQPAAAEALPPLSDFVAASASGCSSRRSSLRDQNSVTIKATTVVKDAAGAIDKILSRGVTALVTALRAGGPPYNTAYDSLNQAVKAIAVARQYAKETGSEGAEVTFLPFLRHDSNERPDPSRFAFLVFPVPHLDEQLKTVDETVLNVARGSDIHKMAGAIIAVMLDRGQAVMKAAGSDAIFVAMSAVVNARHRLILKHGFDLMLAAAWITEDTVSTMGRESKFLRFNVLRTEPAGPKSRVPPTLPTLVET